MNYWFKTLVTDRCDGCSTHLPPDTLALFAAPFHVFCTKCGDKYPGAPTRAVE